MLIREQELLKKNKKTKRRRRRIHDVQICNQREDWRYFTCNGFILADGPHKNQLKKEKFWGSFYHFMYMWPMHWCYTYPS